MKGICRIWFLLSILLTGLNIRSARCQSAIPEFSAFPGVDTHWVDSVMNSLMPEQRLAQLFMLACFTQKDDDKLAGIPEIICKYNLGGVMFMRSSPVKMAKMCNWYQSLARTPLLIAADAEWGLSMRIDSTVSFPRPMSMGAANDEQLVYDAAAEMARQLKRLGIHMNFAPVVDVNNNPQNPVISNRSFGEDKRLVARLGIAYMKGLQDNGIIATAKHFPGHGDTRSDSHFELPQLNFTRERLDTLELYPFREMIKNGVMGIMNGHLNVPALDATPKRPSSLSPKIVTDLLQKEMQFKGLVVTDALGMKGVVDFYKPGVAEKKAFLAGNDLLLYTENFTIAIDTIMKAVQNGEIKQEEIDRRCRKILAAKYWAGLNHYKPIKLEGLTKDLNAGNAEKIKRKLIESSVTIVQNRGNLIPLKGLDTMCVATVFVGKTDTSAFQSMVSNYCKADHFNMKSTEKIADVDTLINQLFGYNVVIIAINNTSNKPFRNYGITPQIIYLVDTLSERSHVILDIFGNPYCLYYLPNARKADAIALSYHSGQASHEVSAEVIFGGLGTKARLPVTASRDFPLYAGVDVKKNSILEYTLPEEAGMDSKELSRIDSIVNDGIKKGAFPGCQVLVARKGMVVYDKSFGYHKYDKKQQVENTDIYDLASLTKVLSTTVAVMDLYDHKKINMDAKLSEFFPEAKQNDKKNTTLRDVMTHQAGFKPFLSFYQATMANNVLSKKYYSDHKSDTFPHRVAEKIFIRKDYPDSIIHIILDTPLKTPKQYEYSDLGFILLSRIVKKISGEPLDQYMRSRFFLPMGMGSTGYKPREWYPLNKIAPTEDDKLFRRQVVHGDVHDPAAAMLGGVSGHAGLFSNTADIAKLLQMFLQKGEYGGVRYLSEKTIEEFTRCQFCESNNRRGLGFDKPSVGGGGPVCDEASANSYGHSGFTGTYFWVDPQYDLIYIFLSNRVYTDAENKKITSMSIRSKIHSVIYKSIQK